MKLFTVLGIPKLAPLLLLAVLAVGQQPDKKPDLPALTADQRLILTKLQLKFMQASQAQNQAQQQAAAVQQEFLAKQKEYCGTGTLDGTGDDWKCVPAKPEVKK